MTDEPIEGSVVDVPDEDAREAQQALARVESEGLMPQAPEPTAQSLSYRQAVELGHVLAASGYFKDATSAAQAAVKVMVGSELGFAPMASIMGVHIVEGRPMIGGNLLAAMLKRDPHFDYRIDELTTTVGRSDDDGLPNEGTCRLVFTCDGVDLEPPVEFTIEHARQAGLLKRNGNWDKWPTKMLYWRALSWGVDFHCPHLAGGVPLLTEGEIEGDDGNGNGGHELQEALHPARPPALSDDKAEGQRGELKAAYDELRELNPTLIVPGQFANMLANSEHSHEALAARIAQIRDLVTVEREIVAAIDLLGEKGGDEAVNRALQATTRMRSRRDVLAHLTGEVGKLDGDPAATDEGGES